MGGLATLAGLSCFLPAWHELLQGGTQPVGTVTVTHAYAMLPVAVARAERVGDITMKLKEEGQKKLGSWSGWKRRPACCIIGNNLIN